MISDRVATTVIILIILLGHFMTLSILYLLTTGNPALTPALVFVGFTYAIVICLSLFYFVLHRCKG